MLMLIIFFLVSIVASFLCSIWEAVLLSITPSFINTQQREGKKLGDELNEFKKDIDRPLSAILTLNTIAHTVGAIGVGIQAKKYFEDKGNPIPGMNLTWETVVAVVMTLAILILSEIIPKTIGANYWRKLANFTVKSLKLLLILLAPLVWVSQLITKKLKNKEVKSVFSREDIVAITSVSEEGGVIGKSESAVIRNLLSLDELTAHDIMTPRSMLQMVDESMSLQSFYDQHKPFRFSRIPVHGENQDDITGFFLKDELLQQILEGKGQDPLSSIKRNLALVHEDKAIIELLDLLTTEKNHIAVTVDDYGSVVGIVSQEDIFETVLGLEITDETDKITDLQAYARRKWEERAKKMGLIQ